MLISRNGPPLVAPRGSTATARSKQGIGLREKGDVEEPLPCGDCLRLGVIRVIVFDHRRVLESPNPLYVNFSEENCFVVRGQKRVLDIQLPHVSGNLTCNIS